MIYTTKRGMAMAEYGDVVDFTRFRLGTIINQRRIEVCPKCGKRAIHTIYHGALQADGTRPVMGHGYHHTQRHVGLAWRLEDTCTVAP